MPTSRWIRSGLLAWLLCLAHPAGADPVAPVILTGEAKEALRLQLAAAFAALQVVNQTYEITVVSPGEPDGQARVDLWREGAWGSWSFKLEIEAEEPVHMAGHTDGIVLAMGRGTGPHFLAGPGVEHLRQRYDTYSAAMREARQRWGVSWESSFRGAIQFSLGVRPAPGEKPFSFVSSMAVGASDDPPSWLAEDFWKAASAEHRPAERTVVLRELQIETTVRTDDGLLQRAEAHADAQGRHVLLTPQEPSETPTVRRERARKACDPLHASARNPHALAHVLDAADRMARVSALLKLPQEPAMPDATLQAWAHFLVETEQAIFALDDWTPETAAKQRDVVRKALLAAIREMAPKLGWPAERAARFAAHLSARWAAVMEPPPAVPAEGGEAR